jgi:hypothetical protein
MKFYNFFFQLMTFKYCVVYRTIRLRVQIFNLNLNSFLKLVSYFEQNSNYNRELSISYVQMAWIPIPTIRLLCLSSDKPLPSSNFNTY